MPWHIAARPIVIRIVCRSRTLLNAQRGDSRKASAPSHRDDCRRKESKRVPRRSRVAVAGVRAPRVAMVLAVTRGAAALRRCARGSAVRGGYLHISVSVISPPILVRSPSNLRYPLAFLRVLALGRAHEANHSRSPPLMHQYTSLRSDGSRVLSRKRADRGTALLRAFPPTGCEEFCSRGINYFHRLCRRCRYI